MKFFRVVECKCCEVTLRKTEISFSEYSAIEEEFNEDMYDEKEVFVVRGEDDYCVRTFSCCKECEEEFA